MIDYADLSRRLREKKHWGPLDVAERLGVARQTVVLVEAGARTFGAVVAARLERLAERWHVSLGPSTVAAPPSRPPRARRHRTPDAPAGEAIRAWRKAQGWSQERLGAELGVTGVCISFWETGRTAPSPGAAVALAQLMGRGEVAA